MRWIPPRSARSRCGKPSKKKQKDVNKHLSYRLSDIWLIPQTLPLDYSGHIPSPLLLQELIMARYLHIAFGALLITLAGASTYELCSENVLSKASVYTLR